MFTSVISVNVDVQSKASTVIPRSPITPNSPPLSSIPYFLSLVIDCCCLQMAGRKHKKKVYTTPKKIKHKRVKVKLAVLKYYEVGEYNAIITVHSIPGRQ